MALMGSPAVQASGNQAYDKRFAVACTLYESGAAAQAYALFLALSKEQEHPVTFLNLGICCLAADSYESALRQFDKAASLIKPQTIQSRNPDDDIYRDLTVTDGKSSDYRALLPLETSDCLPEHVLATAQRLAVDCCAQLGLWDRVRALGAALSGRSYENVAQALALANGK